jgi:hypothetical protein
MDRLLKSIPALVASLLLLAVAPGSASAAELCDDLSCSNVYPVPTTVKMIEVIGTPAVFTTQQTTTKCGEDFGEFTTTNSSPLEAKITSLVFFECLTGCSTVTATNLSWATTIIATGTPGNGTMTAAGPALGMKLSGCPGGTSCTLSTTKIGFEITGGNPAIVKVKAALSGTAPCGNSTWTSTYRVSSPISLFVL